MSAVPASTPVRTRRVYYISGFDPRGPAFYHRLYRDEAGKQSLLNKAQVQVGARIHRDAHTDAWHVHAEWEGTEVRTEYRFLAWDDIVRQHWAQSRLHVTGASILASVDYVRSGAFRKLRAHFSGPLFTAAYPLVYFLLILLAALAAAGLVAGAVQGAAGGIWIARLAGAGAGLAVIVAGIRWAESLGIYWLLRIYLFVHRWGSVGVPALDERMDVFAAQIERESSKETCDEVLVVGHSVGSMVAVGVAARIAERLPAERRRDVTLVTLGQCIPLLSLLPGAFRFRADLKALADARELPWLDMNARADSLCFAQANPVEVSGVAAAGGGQGVRPLQQVVRPFRMFAPADYARLRRNKLRLHFQYLMASALLNEYDYFRMTAGPDRLHASQSA